MRPTRGSGSWPPTRDSGSWPPTRDSGSWPPTRGSGSWPPTRGSGSWPPTQGSGSWPPLTGLGQPYAEVFVEQLAAERDPLSEHIQGHQAQTLPVHREPARKHKVLKAVCRKKMVSDIPARRESLVSGIPARGRECR